MLLEVIVQSVADARAAEAGGADRVEVVRDIERDGLAPSLEILRAITCETGIPVRAMLREHDGFAPPGPIELAALQRTIAAYAELRLDGIVIGFAKAGVLHLPSVDAILSCAPTLLATHHRAFDTIRDPLGAIAAIRTRPRIDRILTSGGPGHWPVRCRCLQTYSAAAGPSLTILAGGGINEEGLRELVAAACVREVHVGRAARVDNRRAGPVSADRVRRLKDIAGA